MKRRRHTGPPLPARDPRTPEGVEGVAERQPRVIVASSPTDCFAPRQPDPNATGSLTWDGFDLRTRLGFGAP